MKAFKSIIFFIAFLTFGFIHAQEKAMVSVLVTDFKNNSRQGETILFVGEKSGETVENISDKNGAFKIALKGGDTYMIKIKGIVDEQDYNRISIPKLEEGQMYGEYSVLIKYEPPRSFTLNNVHFDANKSSLSKDSYKELNELLSAMQVKESLTIEVVGHTDNIGEEAANLLLSKKRAENVRTFLIKNGIDQSRVKATGYGEGRPIATNNTPEGRHKNRRTEVHIIKD
ncbi:MAG TPA: OmpA family protein [Bacteroidetes bacterium]|nr:OmpA family protein [Bacteroidota bacterium]